jgi:pSer/pThr/pTyr-binding forkhead associated (FHA) protein
MSDLALFLVRAAFVVVLWIFIFTIISVVRSDLFGQKLVRKVVNANAPQVLSTPILPPSAGQPATASGGFAQPASKSSKAAKPAIVAERLLITAGDKAGYQLKLGNRDITIGRSESSDLVIDDEFASTNHARLFKANGLWMVEDLNSTNGTYLDGEKVTSAVVLAAGAEVRIGKTAFELQG